MSTPPTGDDQAIVDLEEQTTARVRHAVEAALAAGLTAAAIVAAGTAVLAIVRAAVRRAVQVGAATVARVAPRRRGRRRARPRAVQVSPRLEGVLTRQIRDAVERAVAGLRGMAGEEAARERAAQLGRRLAGIAATTVNQAAAAGVDAAARQAGADGIMWVAERNACLHCTALSGRIVPVGRPFPWRATYADRPLRWAGFDGRPPRHPFCRCRVRAVWGDAQGVAAALQREARRSVVRGFSLPSESQAARLRAAGRLLRRGANLPGDVEAYGRAAVRRSRFPRGRDVPRAGRRAP
jgi:hypothetical protein